MEAFFARNRLSAYLDGELTAAEAREVEAALARDPTLRRELDELRTAVELLHEDGLVEPPAGFADRLSDRLAAEPMPVGWRRWARAIRPEALILAAAAILVVVYVGNHKSVPDLETPTAGVVAGKAFDKADDAAAEAAPTAQTGGEAGGTSSTPAELAEKPGPSPVGTSADGVLGDEMHAANTPPTQKSGGSAKPSLPKLSTSSSGGSGEVEPWQADWEKNPEYSPLKGTKAGGTTAPSAPPGEVRWTSPPPFSYKVTASDDMALKKLAAIAKELGGELQDARGRPLAGYQLDEGESTAVRVAVPAHNAGVLAARLRELGAVVTVKEDGNLLADPNADIPVSVTIQN